MKKIQLCAAVCGATFLYISTDYVFDGRNPPYGEDDAPNPLNVYGRSKLEGERETLRHCPGARQPSVHCYLSCWSPSFLLDPHFVCSLRRSRTDPAGTHPLWGGGVRVGERRHLAVATCPGHDRELHSGPLPAEVPH